MFQRSIKFLNIRDNVWKILLQKRSISVVGDINENRSIKMLYSVLVFAKLFKIAIDRFQHVARNGFSKRNLSMQLQ